MTTAIQILKPVVIKEITEEFEGAISGKTIHRKKQVIDKKKTAVKSTALLAVGTSIIYALSAFGYLPPEIAELLNAILMNPETVEAVEKVVN